MKNLSVSLNADSHLNALLRTIKNGVDKYAPEKCLPVSHRKINRKLDKHTKKIKNAMEKRDRLFTQWIENLDETNNLS